MRNITKQLRVEGSSRYVSKKSAPFCPQGFRTRQDIMGSSVKAPVEREWTSSSLLAWTGDDELFWHILRPSWKSMQTKYTCAWYSIEKGVLYQSALSAMLRLLLAAMESKQRLLLLSSHQTKLKLVWQTAARWWGQRGAAIISCCFLPCILFSGYFVRLRVTPQTVLAWISLKIAIMSNNKLLNVANIAWDSPGYTERTFHAYQLIRGCAVAKCVLAGVDAAWCSQINARESQNITDPPACRNMADSTAETAQKLQISRTKGRRQTAVAKKTFVSNLVGEIKGLHSKCIVRIWASKIANVLTLP